MTLDTWLTVAFGVVSISATWFFARYYYRRTDRRRIPTFVVAKNQRVLCSPALFAVEGIRVFQGQQLKQPTYIRELLVYFWNSGTLAIQKSEVLEQFTIHLPPLLLQFKVLKSSRPVIGFRVEEFVGDLILDFSVLEPNDGATISIVYEANEEATPEFTGACLEVAKPTVLPPADFYFKSRWQRVSNSALVALPVLVLLFVLIVGGGKAFSWASKQFPSLHLNVIGEVLFWLLVVLWVGGILFGFGAGLLDLLKQLRSAYVPSDIKPPRT